MQNDPLISSKQIEIAQQQALIERLQNELNMVNVPSYYDVLLHELDSSVNTCALLIVLDTIIYRQNIWIDRLINVLFATR